MTELSIPPGRLIVGLTGNIATGKSAVMALAAERGALTIDADKLVHEILDEDTAVQEAIVDAFGPDVRRPDGRIDRPALGAIVFGSPQALRRLEQIVHPAVGVRVVRRIAAGDAPVVFLEAIKLLEGQLHAICREVWVTTCSRELQLARLQICRGLDEATAVARIDAQPPQSEKIARADVVINTEGTMAETRAQFAAAWERLEASLVQAGD